jgi:succinoglycan biosynthesis protein ExoA
VKLAKQYYTYGRGRARTLLKLGKLLSVRPAVPFLMTVGGAVLLVTAPLQPVTPYAFGAYALLTGAEAVRVGRKAGFQAIPLVWAIFPTLHVAHGIGFAAGLIKYGLNPDWTEPEVLSPLRDMPLMGEPAEA